MLKLPGNLSAEKFLARHWQKTPLFIPCALARLRPSVTRNELGWLATLDDVESRLVFTERHENRLRYTAETGPFDPEYLAALPRRDWTLLVHDVEKHLPVMRKLFAHVPFVPEWRIDDLMVSFAAPGGGVGPHRDYYDVFLCQGIGVREWHVSTDDIADDRDASDDLALTAPFEGRSYSLSEGDVLYLPPGVAHWGTATRACMTYSIGMRAPQLSDLLAELPDGERANPFYRDPDLAVVESRPGFISSRSVQRAMDLLDAPASDHDQVAEALGRYVTQTKDWITPEGATAAETSAMLKALSSGAVLPVHGMARIAFDDRNLYVNGAYCSLPPASPKWLELICTNRAVKGPLPGTGVVECVAWMLKLGAFEIHENS